MILALDFYLLYIWVKYALWQIDCIEDSSHLFLFCLGRCAAQLWTHGREICSGPK